MIICHGCGGIVGRDCYNPVECEMIARDMQHRHEAETALTEREFAILAGLRDGSLVAVPKEQLEDIDTFIRLGLMDDDGCAAWVRVQRAAKARRAMLAAAQEPGHD